MQALDPPLAAAGPDHFGPGAPGFSEFELGARTLQDALLLAESRASAPSVLLLLRSSVLSLLGAQLARQAAHAQPALAEAAQDRWALLRRQPGVAPVLEQLSEPQRELLQRLLVPEGQEVAAALQAAQREQCLIALERIAFALGDPLERAAAATRAPRTARRLRVGAAAAGLLLALTALLVALLSRPNLALHKPALVETSDPELAISPERVVDGDRSNLGFATPPGGAHSVRIDLQSVQRIRSVHVYNRMDCCLDRAVPLSLEVSSDGEHFRSVAQRTRRFALWKARFAPIEARWVRLVHLGSEPFHLSEIEVY